MRYSALVVAFWLTAGVACTAAGKIIYVDDDANGPGDGKSWTTPYRYLQDALQEGQPLPSDPLAVNPSTQRGAVRSLRLRSVGSVTNARDSNEPLEIRVAQGVYKPDEGIRPKAGDRSATFQLISGLALKGGYAGVGAADPNARDRRLCETILSGDLASNDVAVDDPCDLEHDPSRAENSYHVLRAFMLDGEVVLEQVTITGGNADGDPPSDRYKGGGLLCESSWNLRLVMCTFRENFADTGGGMFNYNSDPDVTLCSFVGNAASAAGGFGGGMAGTYRSSPTLNSCTFSCNHAAGGGGASNMGGQPKFVSCAFTHNLAASGGAAWMDNIDSKIISFEGCRFDMNSASTGGAMATGIVRCALAHCVFATNSAELSGGAIHMQSTEDLSANNCTFSDNTAPKGQAFSLEHGRSTLHVASSILWDAGEEIWNANNSAVMVTYTNSFGGLPGVGNMDVDPGFADPSGGDYHLRSKAGRWHPRSNSWILDDATSPCIDAGDPNAPIGLEPFPNGGRVNMGAYGGTLEASKSYYGKTPCLEIVAGDINGDCQVDFGDLVILASHWLD